MKKLFIVLIAFLFLFSFAVPVMAGGCGDRNYGGECFNPGFDDTGSIGTSTHRWGEGYFQDLHSSTKVTRIAIPLGSMFIDGTGPITDSTAPNLTTKDNTGKIVYDNSGETAEIQFEYYPGANATGMSVNLLVNSDTNVGTRQIGVGWGFYHNADVSPFGTLVPQYGFAVADTVNESTSNNAITLTMDATAFALLTPGSSAAKIVVFNASVHVSASLEISHIWINETGF